MDKELTKDCKSNQELELPWRPGTPKVASNRKACRIVEVQSDSRLAETLATAVFEERAGEATLGEIFEWAAKMAG